MADDVQVTVTEWNHMQEFYEQGIQKSYEMEDFDEDKFYSFADRLVEYYSEPFKIIAEQMEEPRISIATPKPEPMNFKESCRLCDSDKKIPNEEIHFEVHTDEVMLFICKDCFLTLPKMDESLKEKTG